MDNINKKNKYSKIIVNLYKKLKIFTDHIEYLFINKFINHNLYLENMYILNELYSKISNLDYHNNNIKKNIKDINKN